MIGESPLGEANNIMPALLDVAIGKKEFLTIFGNDYETRDGLSSSLVALWKDLFEYIGVTNYEIVKQLDID